MKFSEIIKAHIISNVQNSIGCPLCSEPMQHNGVAWFCYSRRDEHSVWLYSRREAAYQYQLSGGVVFFVDLRTPPRQRPNNWDPDLQGAILAVSTDGWFFATIRGMNGVTNFRVTAPDGWDGVIPQTVDWVWAEWTHGNEGD